MVHTADSQSSAGAPAHGSVAGELPKQHVEGDGEACCSRPNSGSGPGRPGGSLLICNEDHRFIVAEQMRQIGVPNAILLEPMAATPPWVTVAALQATANEDPVAGAGAIT